MDVSPSPPRPVRFGVFELDLRSGELRKAGARLKLSDQPFQILAALLERPGQLVTRDELRQRLWPADTFVDVEHGLNAAVKRLRETLGDTADAPRFIETVPRRGYRFIAPSRRPESRRTRRARRRSALILPGRAHQFPGQWVGAGHGHPGACGSRWERQESSCWLRQRRGRFVRLRDLASRPCAWSPSPR
jgi:DNA-binding winged helix-turn-helix (wHTH) protein